MRRTHSFLVALAALAACDADRPDAPGTTRTGGALLAQSVPVDIVGDDIALTTPAQRHVVRVAPPGHAPVQLMAVQNDGFSNHHAGLLWYRTGDAGATWSFYRDVIAQPDPAVFNTARHPDTLHLTADLLAVGSDVAAVYSFDTTTTGFAADAWDPNRVVYFQWWRFDGANDWIPGPRLTIASPGPGQAYHRAMVARDAVGRLWVQAFLRQSDCASVGSTSCAGDLLQVWVSTDGGATFSGPQSLAALPHQIGGGRLIAAGSHLLMLWGDYSLNPAQLRTRSDADPLATWSAQANAFADGASIYHGASVSAAGDGAGGLHLVYKQWVASPDQQQLYYRHFDGASFGPAQPFDARGDWALQPAITSADGELYICVNHTIATNANYEIRSYRLGAGLASWTTLDAQAQAKIYPAAPELAAASDGVIPCAFGMGNDTTQFWGAGHTVQAALQPIQAAPAAAAAPTFSPAPGAYTAQQSVTLADATPGAVIHYTLDGTTPTAASAVFTGPVAVASTLTIKAFASATGFLDSAVATGTYTIQASPPPPPPPPTIAFVNATPAASASAASQVSLAAIPVQAGNAMLVGVILNSGTSVASVTDQAGNAFALQATKDPGSGYRLEIWASFGVRASASDAITVRLLAPVNHVHAAACQYSGLATAGSLDVTASATASSATSVTSGTFTPSGSGELAFALASASNNTTWSSGAGYRVETRDAQLAIEDATGVAATPQTAFVSSSAAVNLRILVATFR